MGGERFLRQTVPLLPPFGSAAVSKHEAWRACRDVGRGGFHAVDRDSDEEHSVGVASSRTHAGDRFPASLVLCRLTRVCGVIRLIFSAYVFVCIEKIFVFAFC